MEKILRQCTPEDLPVLKDLSARIFIQTFGKDNTQENMEAYLSEAFSDEKLMKELSNPNSRFFIVYADQIPAGYLKINDGGAQSELKDPAALEIERIYVSADFQGKKLGLLMIDHAIETAKKEGKDYVWLGVWQENDKAQQFYRRRGFYKFGEHPFILGDDRQTDDLMRLDLKSAPFN